MFGRRDPLTKTLKGLFPGEPLERTPAALNTYPVARLHRDELHRPRYYRPLSLERSRRVELIERVIGCVAWGSAVQKGVRQEVRAEGLVFEELTDLSRTLTINGLQVALSLKREGSASPDPNITLLNQHGISVGLEAACTPSGAAYARVALWRQDRLKVPSLIVQGTESPDGQIASTVEVGGQQLTGLGDQLDAFKYVNRVLLGAAEIGGITVVQ